MMLNYAALLEQIDCYAARGEAFFFLINYLQTEGYFLPISSSFPHRDECPVLYDINGRSNCCRDRNCSSLLEQSPSLSFPVTLRSFPEPFERYQQRFEIIQEGLRQGNSFLANLTLRTPIESPLSLSEIFHRAHVLYKVWVPGRFVCFSPERFVYISESGQISSNPMKGTIDATLPHAEELLLSNPKEQAEHATIVDLIRNDLSRVADGVHVSCYRYLDRIETDHGALWQASSEIVGQLPHGWQAHLGQLIEQLLPAGSITGAPKQATCQLIARAEQHDRGYYTGICGYFDGYTLDTGVLIRYIEQTEEGRHFFHSGGGITINSDARSEYQEVIEKIYLPFR